MALSEKISVGDLIKWECNGNFTRAVLTLKENTSQSIEIGSPLRDDTGYILVVNGQEANVTAIALEFKEATGGENILCLVRGPAIINKDRLHLEANVTFAELNPYLKALGILGLAEPTNYDEGTPIT
jgi:hypothetical protein